MSIVVKGHHTQRGHKAWSENIKQVEEEIDAVRGRASKGSFAVTVPIIKVLAKFSINLIGGFF